MRQGLVSFLLFGLLLVGMACTPEPKTRVIAHRGYWQTEGSAQNSIRSLERADEIGVYGAEFDVHYTADNVLVYPDYSVVKGAGTWELNLLVRVLGNSASRVSASMAS